MIDILMATYNGGGYIENQILSLIGQTYKDWKLLIHDDGSSDDTIQIIKKYEKLDSRIKFIDDNIKCGGAAQNFLHLLKHSNADYIIFCDQDDIWLEKKLELLYNAIKQNESDSGVGVYSSGYLYDENGINNQIPTSKPCQLSDQLFLNAGLQGCAILFNKKLRDYMLRYNGSVLSMHDHLLTLALLSFGKILYIPEKLMLYRQGHINKVTDNIELSTLKRIKKQIFSEFGVLDETHYGLTKAFFEQFAIELEPNKKKEYLQFFEIVNEKNKFSRIIKVLSSNFKLDNSKIKLIIKILLRPIVK